jgi:hypothetical protein
MTQHRASVVQTRKLAAALVRAAREHGVPNSFGLAELHAYYGAPKPMTQGLVGRHDLGLLTVEVKLMERGLTVAGYTPQGRAPKTPASFHITGRLEDG